MPDNTNQPDDEKKLPEELLPDLLQVPPSPPDFYKETARRTKERGASWVAKGLILIFGGTLLVCLVGGFILIKLYPPVDASQSGKDNVVGVAVVPLFQGISTLASSVFSPLLAFVLGYYFGEKRQANE